MELVVILRKEVPDDATADTLVNALKEMLSDVQDLKMQAQVTRRYPTES